jgi:hypothetical protein
MLPSTVVVVVVVDVVVGTDVVVDVVVDEVVWVIATPPGPRPAGPMGLLFSQATTRAATRTHGRSSLRIGIALSNRGLSIPRPPVACFSRT